MTPRPCSDVINYQKIAEVVYHKNMSKHAKLYDLTISRTIVIQKRLFIRRTEIFP
jgi:hypothetical protein